MTIEFAPSAKMHHATRAKMSKIATTLAAEYPHVTIEVIGEDIDHDQYDQSFDALSVLYGEEEVGQIDPKAVTLEAILEAVVEAGFDPEADPETGEVEDDEPSSRSTVDDRYKVLYAEVSENGRNCGDWLASFLNDQCLTGKTGTLDVDRFASVLINNGIEMGTPKWASAYRANGGARGWQGRFRMSGRVVLEKVVAQNAVIFGADGQKFSVPADALEALRAKHAKALAKLRKGNKGETQGEGA